MTWKIYLKEAQTKTLPNQEAVSRAAKITKRMDEEGDHPVLELMKEVSDFIRERLLDDALSIGNGWWGEALSELIPTIASAPPPEQPAEANAYVESLTDEASIDRELSGVAVGLDALTSDPGLYTPERAAAIKSLQKYKAMLQNRRARVVYYGSTGKNPLPSSPAHQQPANPQPANPQPAGPPATAAIPGNGATPRHNGPESDTHPPASSETPVETPAPAEQPAPQSAPVETPKPAPPPPPPPAPAPPSAPPVQGPVQVHQSDSHEGARGSGEGGHMAGGPGDGGGHDASHDAALFRPYAQPARQPSSPLAYKSGCVVVSNPTAGTWRVCFKDRTGAPLIVKPFVKQ